MTNQLPFGLKEYIISNLEILPDNRIEQRVVKAKNKDQAWSKFVEQYFGSLKPNPKSWIITELVLLEEDKIIDKSESWEQMDGENK